MASYTKQMIEQARPWLEANPDSSAGLLHVPRMFLDTGAASTSADIRRAESLRERYPHLRQSAEFARNLDELRGVQADLQTRHRDLGELHDRLEFLLNDVSSIGPCHEKFSAGHAINAYLGRWFVTWAHQGYNTIDLSADFAATMLLTDPRELDLSKVQLPFRGLLFLIPDGFATGAEGLHYTKVHVTEIPRKHVEEVDVFGKVRDVLDQLPKAEQRGVIEQLQLREQNRHDLLSQLSIGAAPTVLAVRPKDEIKLLHVYATDGIHVLSTLVDRQRLSWDELEQVKNDIELPADDQAMRAIRQIIMGALAYATAIPSELTRATDPPRPPAKGRGSPPSPLPARWDLGRTVVIDPNLVRAARGGSREVAYRLKHRHIVRGHYKRQAHGVGRALRTQIFIAPYWQGPKDGAALVHTYKIAGGEDAK